MKIRLVIDSEEKKGGGPFKGFELLPDDNVAAFVDAMAESYEKRAFFLYDEIERLIKEGDIDSVVTLADEAKACNDYYLLLDKASDLLYEKLAEETA